MNARQQNPVHIEQWLNVWRIFLLKQFPLRCSETQVVVRVVLRDPELIARKVAGPEKGRLDQADLNFHEREHQRLRAELEQAYEQSHLPENARGASAMNDLLVRVRLSRRGD